MLLNRDTKDYSSLLENWPDSFYELQDGKQRNELLKLHMQSVKNDPEDLRRMQMLQKRYSGDGHYSDHFMHAWVMLKMKENEGKSILFQKKRKREVQQLLEEIGVFSQTDDLLLEEWKHFASYLILTDAESKSYRSMMFGMVSVNDEKTAVRIAQEIIAVTRNVPAMYGYAEETELLHSIFKDTYIRMIQNGEEIFTKVME